MPIIHLLVEIVQILNIITKVHNTLTCFLNFLLFLARCPLLASSDSPEDPFAASIVLLGLARNMAFRSRVTYLCHFPPESNNICCGIGMPI